MKAIVFGVAILGLGLAGAQAQAPAGAPAGSNGICKDGTYSTAASKSGACRGHQGVQTWYTASAPKTTGAPAVPAATVSPKPVPSVAPPTVATKPVPSVPAPVPTAVPVKSVAPATTASTPGKKLSPEQAAALKTAAPGGGPGLVWVNSASNVYHCNGDAFYGKTKAGAYMSESAATAKGAHGDHGKTCAGK